MKQPANDVCRVLAANEYLDVVWRSRGRWLAMVRGRRIGYWPTRRRAKKAAEAAL